MRGVDVTKDTLLDYLKGQTEFSLEDIFNASLRIIFGAVNDFLPELCIILGLLIFGAVLDAVKISSFDGGINELGFFVIIALETTLVSSMFFSVFSSAKDTVDLLTVQIRAATPIMLSLIVASGANVTAQVFRPSVAFICSAQSTIAQTVLFPIITLLFVFGALSCLTKTIKIAKFSDFFKSLFKWIVGAVSLVFTFFVSGQGIAAAKYDGFSIKALKYLVGSGVPIASQIFSGGVDVVFAACVLIKNSLGLLTLVSVGITCLSPIIKTVVLSLFLRFLAAAVEPCGDERTVKLLSVTADCLNLVVATVISVAIVYMICIFIMICSLG